MDEQHIDPVDSDDDDDEDADISISGAYISSMH
jgi:hypothetical protein